MSVFKITLENQINVLWYLLLFYLNLISFSLFSYSNLIILFKDIGLCGIEAFIRPVFLESQKIHLTIWGNKSLVVKCFEKVSSTLKKKKLQPKHPKTSNKDWLTWILQLSSRISFHPQVFYLLLLENNA